jgi:RimJ/RimL family protein N-acetyltransferase
MSPPRREPFSGIGVRDRLEAVRIELVTLSPPALAAGDRVAAEQAIDLQLSDYAMSAWRSTWQRRHRQVTADPRTAAWVTGPVVDAESRVVVGRAGFHGPPDARGMVEIGYAIDPAYRRQGYARAGVAALLDRAQRDPAVKILRACVRPDNEPSWRVLEPYGFMTVGEQWDDEDGTELIVELSLNGQYVDPT